MCKPWFRRAIYLATACVASTACGTRSSAARLPAFPQDTTLFAAVVQAIPSKPLRVDPRRFYGLDPLPPGLVAQRTKVLNRLRIGITDRMEDAKCHGMVPPPHDPTGCPSEGSYYSVTIGLPERTAAGAVVRTDEVVVTPHGAASSGWEHHFRYDPRQGWVLVERVNLFMD